jgi:hypothetical protein
MEGNAIRKKLTNKENRERGVKKQRRKRKDQSSFVGLWFGVTLSVFFAAVNVQRKRKKYFGRNVTFCALHQPLFKDTVLIQFNCHPALEA